MSEKPTDPPTPQAVPPGITPLPNPPVDLDSSDPANLVFANIPPSDDVPTQISRRGPEKFLPPADQQAPGNWQGKKLAHYELIEPLGRGGMATVLKARDTILDRLVALKILPPDMAVEADHVQRFSQEARAAAKLDHENIARVFFCGQDQKLHFIAFEFVEGTTLKSVLEARGRLPYLEALQVMIQVARGLTHAASRGVVHRDIKPSNIIITPEQRAKIVDMGLARSLGPAEGGLTQSGVTLGTFDYISPEQALEPRDADHRSDIYSLGCTFYHALTGKCPVPEGTAARKLYHHQHVKPADPRLILPDIPPSIIAVLDRMMAKKQEDRFQSPGEMLLAMERAGQELGMEFTPSQPAATLPAPTIAPDNSRAWIPLAAFALLALVILIDSFGGPSGQAPSGWLTQQTAAKNSPAVVKDPGNTTGKEGMGNPPGMIDNPQAAALFDKEEFTLAELLDWLDKNKNAAEIEIVLSKDLDLSPGEGRNDPGLLIAGKKVTLRGKDPSRPPVLKLNYDGRAAVNSWALLAFEADEVTVQDLKLVMDARLSDTRMQGLLIKGGKNHMVRRCQVVQAQASPGETPSLVSLALENSGSTRPSLVVDGCCFLGFEQSSPAPEAPGKPDGMKFRQAENGGQAAIHLAGNGSLLVRDCVFSPHDSVIHVTGSADQENKIILQHCSILAANGTTLVKSDRAITPAIEMRQSIYARATDASAPQENDGASLMKLANAGNTLRFSGQDNRYFQIEPFLALPFEQETLRDLGSFQKYLARNSTGKDESRILELPPWKDEQPLKLLEENRLGQAFQVKDAFRDTRLPSSPADRLLGAERFLQFSYLSSPLPALETRPDDPVAKVRMVDPGRDEPAGMVFKSLEQALATAKNGETILLNWDGDQIVSPIRLEKSGVEITLKPAPGKKPVLVPASPKEGESGALFQVVDSTLRLDGLEFHIRPNAEGRTHSLGIVGKSGSLIIRNCSITMEKGTNTNLPALFAQAGESNLMMMDAMPGKPPAPPSSLVVDSSKIRGECHLFRNRTNKPCDLQITGSLVAITGSIVRVEGPASPGATAGVVSARFSQSTLCTAAESIHFSNLRKTAAPFPLRAADCLFIPLNKNPLVKLLETEVDSAWIREAVRYEGQRNTYVQVDTPLVLGAVREDVPPFSLSKDEWQEMFQEAQPRHVSQAPEAMQFKPGPFWMAPPVQFRLESAPNAGVMENSLLMAKPGS